ncbi:ribosome silencing factor [Helcobacillus massiliensis]|uniref:ribosome silencing factor n=1 Tax=Helcobacillus massiliensis TaxID=521392 RepID=UPI0021A95508|nr:ribosome silencing factor [Helcobacillus massiliensis]MCT1557269.1 ribosome silencing factor [Helcobacillus massiliensis]MCT2036252.1 ribosome silencing factor [Helcobacillus massiliensis]MCT2331554.1 ribosome silencing factor [Helcobacillus massiliensis]
MSIPQESIDMARVAGQAATDRLAEKVIALDVSEQLAITDIFVIASADSERQVSAVCNGIEQDMHKAGYKLKRREGESDARWILMDFTDIVVHVQHAEDREFYALDRLWRDAPVIDLQLDDGRPAHH